MADTVDVGICRTLFYPVGQCAKLLLRYKFSSCECCEFTSCDDFDSKSVCIQNTFHNLVPGQSEDDGCHIQC